MKILRKIVKYTFLAGVIAYISIDIWIYFRYKSEGADKSLTWYSRIYSEMPGDSIPDNVINAYEKVYPGSLTNHIYPDFAWLVFTRLNRKNLIQELLAYDIRHCNTIELISFANQLDNKLSQKQCIYLYLRRFDFLNQAEGINQAAEIYYSKSVKELTEIECLELAIMTKNPSLYDKFTRQAELDKKVKEVMSRK